MAADAKWPRGPVAPTNLAGTGGNGQISLTWTAPATTHGTITNYAVEFTPSGGSPTVTLTGSTAASYTVTGLTNGTQYTVRVAGVNHTQGDWSSGATVTPNASPLTVSVASTGSGTSLSPYLVNVNDFSVTANVAGVLYYKTSGPCPDCNWALFLNGAFKVGGPGEYRDQSMTASQVINITAGGFTNELPRSIYFVPS
jgi:hypothetical protein